MSVNSEYKATVESSVINGDVRLVTGEDGLTAESLFDVYHLPYAEITAFEMQDYAVLVRAGNESLTFTRLGREMDSLYESLYDAYNNKVRKALFVEGKALMNARGEFQYNENCVTAHGNARIEVHENCLLILPPDAGARRIPFSFLNTMERNGGNLKFGLSTGESYSLSKLGYDETPVWDCIERLLRLMRENSIKAVLEIDGSLNARQAAAIARLMPDGVSAPLGLLAQIAPSFAAAITKKIDSSRAAACFLVFKELGSLMNICVGMKSGFGGDEGENILWIAAPGPKPGTAAVEFAGNQETSAATFLYHGFQTQTDGWERFQARLNQALEAISFKREVIRLSEAELLKPEYSDYIMAARRNFALRFVRGHFAGRLIHTSPEQWRSELNSFMQV